MPATVSVPHVIKVPFRLSDITNESVEVLHEILESVTAYTAVKGGHGGDVEIWPLQIKSTSWSNSRVQFGDDVVHLIVLLSATLPGMVHVNCTAVFGHSWSAQGWPFETQERYCPAADDCCVKKKKSFNHKGKIHLLVLCTT